MFNKVLYDALQLIFKSVLIDNEGIHASITLDPSGSGKWTIVSGDQHGEQYRVGCPFCKDKKHHLYISYTSYMRPKYQGVPLRIGGLRAQCFRSNCLQDKENRNELERKIGLAMAMLGNGSIDEQLYDLDGQIGQPQEKEQTASDEVTLEGLKTWVPDWHEIDENAPDEIIEYLIKRGITYEDIEWTKMGWGPIRSPRTNKYLNNGTPWILFPIINNGKLKGVQARCPDSLMASSDSIKYWLHPGCRKGTLLFNLDYARDTGVAVVCEGIFDVISVGRPGVCCFGHTPSKTQQTLLEMFQKGLIWLPDTDVSANLNAINIAKRQVDQWNSYNKYPLGAHVVVLPKKDAGAMTRQEVWETILNQVGSEMSHFIKSQLLEKL